MELKANSFIFFCSRKRNQGCVIAVINCFANRYLGVYLSINLLIKRENPINIFHIGNYHTASSPKDIGSATFIDKTF